MTTTGFPPDAERKEDTAPEKAVFQGCLLRFRPIMRTTMSELRPIPSQLPTLFSAPAIYLWFDRLAHCFKSLPIEEGEGRTCFPRISR